ncbi:MAG TPA: DUF2079 domain-containing protein [Ktedonobacterales bacterium]|nr:DUF2079 domain-containing protein [Ktedonobacterales bacterium]
MSATDVRITEQPGEHPNTPAIDEQGSSWPARLRTLAARALNRYPELPPAPQGTLARVCLGSVAALALAFVVFFSAYMFARHDAYQTFAEDMGIMDQALWNLAHGAGLHQTICNNISDNNCLGDVSRLAIHFEPIMSVIGLLYVIVPSPKTLLLLQAVIVASGAFPAYWIASRRLRSAAAGVGFAALYLLYPPLQAAVTYDFHAVTLSAAFLMFALYFMLARNDKGLIVASLLAMATKENIPLDILLIGLSVALLQRRWRFGLGLCGLALSWLAVALLVMHIASPLGHSSTVDRYSYLGPTPAKAALYLLTHPVQVIRQHVLDPGGVAYLHTLLSPLGYLPLLSPLTLLIAVPAIAINILSSDPSMRAGIYHYNAEIAPLLVFAAIESVALLAWAAGWMAAHAQPAMRFAAGMVSALGLGAIMGAALADNPVDSATNPAFGDPLALARSQLAADAAARKVTRPAVTRAIAIALTVLALVFSFHEQQGHGYLPITTGFTWPQSTAHTRLAGDIEKLIPANASVSAQATLVPHVSHRRLIYQYPYDAASADYIFLDVTAEIYPYFTPEPYFAGIRQLLASGTVHVVAARDGYLLLERGRGPNLNPADVFGLPESFYSFSDLPAATVIPHPLRAQFGPSLAFLGYDVTSNGRPSANHYLTITTYWQVSAPLSGTYAQQLILDRKDLTFYGLDTFAATALRPLSEWRPGVVYAVQTNVLLGARERGPLRLGVKVQAGQGQTVGGYQVATLAGAPGPQGRAPALVDAGTQVVFRDLTVA